MGNRIRTAVIEPVGGHGGMNYYDFSLCESLHNGGASVTLYTCDETVSPARADFGIRKHFKGIFGKSNKYLRATKYLWGLLRSLSESRANGIRIAHFHFFHTTYLEALSIRAAKAFGMKVVVTAHDVESFSNGDGSGLPLKLYRQADRVIAHNRLSKNELVRKASVDEDKVRVIPHGHYVSYIAKIRSAEEARRALGLEGEGPFLLFFGQIKKVKGLDVLLRALPKVVEAYPSLQLVIAGKVWKDDFGIYDDLIASLNLGENVIKHIRYIADEEVDLYFQAADLVILPYKKIYQSGVLLLTMSYGRPLLTSDIEGMKEIIRDEENGFLFREGDSDHLASRLAFILSNPSIMNEISANGYETIRRDHDWETIGRQTLSVYSEVL